MDARTYFTKKDGRLSREGGELRRVANLCDVSAYYLYMVVAGHKVASAELAANIEYATHRKVNRRVTLPDFPWDQPKLVTTPPNKEVA